MATYKKFCMYCNQLIPGDSALCPICTANDPFELRCPKCRNPVERRWTICSGCGFRLHIPCPSCGRESFAAPACTLCNAPLVVQCSSKRCGEIQVMSRERKCIKCGKPLK